MSSGHEVPRETLDALSRDTRGDIEKKCTAWERKRQGSQTCLREMMGDKVRKQGNIVGGQGLENKETWKKGSEFAGRRKRHLTLDRISAC